MIRNRNTISTIAILFIADQLTKIFFVDWGRLPGLFTPAINTGAARSLPIPEIIIVIVGIGMSVWLLWIYRQQGLPRWIFTLFLAGIWGNLIDRLFYSGVRDFIQIVDRFPIFNLADTYLTVAVIAVVWYERRSNKK